MPGSCALPAGRFFARSSGASEVTASAVSSVPWAIFRPPFAACLSSASPGYGAFPYLIRGSSQAYNRSTARLVRMMSVAKIKITAWTMG